MELTLENLMKIKPGERFAVFLDGKLSYVFKMLAEQRFIQARGSLAATTPELFVRQFNEGIMKPTIYKAQDIQEPK